MDAETVNYLTRICPSCGSQANANPAVHSEPKAEQLSLDEIKSYWSGFFKAKSFFSYYRCLCGLLYCPTFFTEQQLADLYARMSDNTAGIPLEPLRKTQNSYFKVLKKYSKLDNGYIEFGPDIGLFTENCLREGTFDSYWLLEPNEAVWPELQKKMGNNLHHLFANMEGLASVPDQSVSTVAMIHVLDHLIEPVETLQAIKKKLLPGAIALFVTHDERSLLAKLTKTKWPPFCLQHPQLYNRQSITELLTRAGFNVLTSEKCYNYFPVTYLMKHALYLLGLKNIKLPALNKLQIGLKLGNIITIAQNN